MTQKDSMTKKPLTRKPTNVPKGDRRLSVNLREDLYLKLHMEALKRSTTAGELIEGFIEKHL